MQNKLASGARLGRQALLFPLCLVLYEFSTYIGNDMIQPGMLVVVEQYQAGIDWVPTSMTAYLAGGMFLQWLLGPLSDRIGRRPVMLAGVVWFIITCLAILLAQNIEQFTLLRFLQGISLCFIGADCSTTWPAGGRGVDPCAALGRDVCLVCRIGSDLLFRSATSHA